MAIQQALQGPWCLQNRLLDYFTAKCDFLIHVFRVRFKVAFSHTSTDSQEFSILCYPLRANLLAGH